MRQARHAFVEQLIANGVRHVFGNPGTTEQPLMDALADYPEVSYVLGLHESVVIGIADAYARATQRPAFAQLHAAPGLGNAMGMIFNAHAGHTPMVVYAGQVEQRGMAQEPFLYADLSQAARPFTKLAIEARTGQDVPRVINRAFKEAMTSPPGPVFVAVPADLLDEGAGSFIPPSAILDRARPDGDTVRRLAAALVSAERPVIICGDGIARSGAQAELARLAELIGAPVYTSFSYELNVPEDHAAYAGQLDIIRLERVAAQLEPYDVTFAVGTPVFTLLFPSSSVPSPLSRKRLLHLDSSPDEIGKTEPADLGVIADPRLSLAELTIELERLLSPERKAASRKRLAEFAATRSAAIARQQDAALTRDASPMTPARLMSELSKVLPRDASVFDESMTSRGAEALFLRFTEPGTWFRARGGALGQGMPGPIGLKLARPNSSAIGIVADGAALYTLQSLWTAAHCDIPVTWIILNNRSYRILKVNMVDYLGEKAAGRPFIGMDLEKPAIDFVRAAESFGVEAHRVERAGDVCDALAAAFASGRPRLVEVLIDGST